MSEGRTPSGVVSLLTDFGLRDPYVGVLKGVLLRENSKLALADVSHEVPPQDVAVGAFWIARSFRFFPPGTVHLCVVDPGVGSSRAPIAAEASEHFFVAPDNGLLSDVLAEDAAAVVRRVDLERLGLTPPSRTFHGRDVFAPVAGRLASGTLAFADVGPPHRALVQPRKPVPDAGGATGSVLFADHFGNLVTDIPRELVDVSRDAVDLGGRELRLVGTYAEAEPGECVALVSSFGTLELACRDGSARDALGLDRGARVRVRPRGARQ